jgi:hypothetical protein
MSFRGTGARFSADRLHRYALWRVWDADRGLCNFLMLNPSTAHETADDPTVARCTRRARIWGYGGLVVTNLFAFRTTDPAGLRSAPDPVGPENDAAIVAAALSAGLVVCAWGNHGAYRGRASAVRALLDGLGVTPYHLALTRRGEPAHPLYLGYRVAPVRMTLPRERDLCAGPAAHDPRPGRPVSPAPGTLPR